MTLELTPSTPGVLSSEGGMVERVTSEDESVTITNPTGPTVDLSVEGGGSQPFAPTDLDDLAVWLDASTLALADNAAVALWPDASGNGYDATQATTANKPICKTNILNGLRVVRFVDGGDFKQLVFSGDALSMLSGAPGVTLAAVITNREAGGYGEQDVFWAYSPLSDESGNFRRFAFEFDTTGKYFSSALGNDDSADLGGSGPGVGTGETAEFTAPRVVVWAWDTVKPKAGVDWTDLPAHVDPPTLAGLTPGPLPVAAADSMGIGGDELGYYGFYKLQDCDIAEFIVVARGCDAGERRQLAEYLSAKWGVL